MKYTILNIVASLAGAMYRRHLRSAEEAARLASKADHQALVYASNKVRAEVSAKEQAQKDAEAAYNRCRANFERSTWEAVLRLAELKKKHTPGSATKVKQ